MGCANSKQSRCKNCQSPYSPVPRSYSMHVHHPPQQKGESYHVVALTSTTLGSLKLDTSAADQNHNQHRRVNGYAAFHDDDGEIIKPCVENVNGGCDKKSSDEFSMGVIEAKTWSNMINEKIPKIIPRTPIRTPPGEPETINTWELMEGLEDASPFRSVHHIRSFSFDIVRNPIQVSLDRPKSRLQENGNDLNSKLHENETVSQKPIWLQIADSDTNLNSIISDFDPDVISTFRKSMEELSPDNPFYLKPPVTTNNDDNDDTALDATDTKKIDEVVITDYKCQPCGKEKLILYFTSLRGVRKTYEDCCHVRVILKGVGIRVDERDVSMHSVFKDELKELLGDGFPGGGLPRVFVGKKYIGGAEEIRRMHEEGQLEKALERCEKVDDGGSGGGGGVCEACGDVRFVPCETCSGSCKIYYEGGRGGNDDEEVDSDEEKEDEETYHKEEVDDEKEEDSEFGFQRCPDCNENGLIRCPICCD